MGSSVGTSCGFAHATTQKIVCFMGDSTFFHSGLPGIVNATHHQHDCVITVLDNCTTAMTGHQSHPGIQIDGMGDPAISLKIEDAAKGLGVKHVEVTNPYHISKTKEAFKRALDYKGPSVVVSRAPCILLTVNRRRAQGTKLRPFQIDQDKCTRCNVCIQQFGCPAFYFKGDQVLINEAICNSCGVCVQICASKAIKRK